MDDVFFLGGFVTAKQVREAGQTRKLSTGQRQVGLSSGVGDERRRRDDRPLTQGENGVGVIFWPLLFDMGKVTPWSSMIAWKRCFSTDTENFRVFNKKFYFEIFI
jgi:hypothetical protein